MTMLLTGLALAIGWLASWAVSVGTKPFREQLVTHSGRGFFERASRLAARGVLDLLIAMAFTAAGFLVIALTLPGNSLRTPSRRRMSSRLPSFRSLWR